MRTSSSIQNFRFWSIRQRISLISFHFFQNISDRDHNLTNAALLLIFHGLGGVRLAQRCFVFLSKFHLSPLSNYIKSTVFIQKRQSNDKKYKKKVHFITLLLFLVLITHRVIGSLLIFSAL